MINRRESALRTRQSPHCTPCPAFDRDHILTSALASAVGVGLPSHEGLMFVPDEAGGDAERIWTDAGSGREVFARLNGLPGFGKQKAQIFTALLGRQCGVAPEGWREAAGSYGDDGARRSIADVVDPVTLGEVREFKQAQKKAAKAAKG